MCEEIKDEESVAKEIERILVDAWNNFLDYYKKKAPVYWKNWLVNSENKKQAEKKAKELNWICWNENDLTFHIGRFFYDILKKKENLFSNIEIHLEKTVNPTNFKGYEFEGKLEELKRRLINKEVLKKRYPKIDMIAAYEDRKDSFLLCAEVKCFRYDQNHYAQDPNTVINKDIEKLKAIRDCEIARRVVFILFDDYYWYTNKNVADEIKNKLAKIEREENIKVLFETSKAKLL